MQFGQVKDKNTEIADNLSSFGCSYTISYNFQLENK